VKSPMRLALLVTNNLLAFVSSLVSWKRIALLHKHGETVGTFERFQVVGWTVLLVLWLAIDFMVWKRRKRGSEIEQQVT
jgi:hypothetical protein